MSTDTIEQTNTTPVDLVDQKTDETMNEEDLATLDVWENAVVGYDAIVDRLGETRPYLKNCINLQVGTIEATINDVIDSPDTSVVCLDVGCGTGSDLLKLADKPAFEEHSNQITCVGVDISTPSIDIANRKAKDMGVADNFTFVAADATKLTELEDVQAHLNPDKTRIVSCLGNTLGILRGDICTGTIREMCSLIRADTNDRLYWTVWNGEKFDFARDNYYPDIREIAGVIPPECFNFDTHTVLEPNTDYYSHWWMEDELREILTGHGLEIEQLEREEHCFSILAKRA